MGVSEGLGVNQGGIKFKFYCDRKNLHALAVCIYFTNKFELSQKLSMAKQSVSFTTYINKS